MGGWVHKDVYKGKFMLEIKDVAAKLVTRLDNCWARWLMEKAQLVECRKKELITDADTGFTSSEKQLYGAWFDHQIPEEFFFSYQYYNAEIQEYLADVDWRFAQLAFELLRKWSFDFPHPDAIKSK